MKNFVLDSTYKDITVVNSNDDISIVASHDLSCGITNLPNLNLSKTTTNYIYNPNKNFKSNKFNVIDYL